MADVVVRESDTDAVLEVYRSGWLTMGPRTEALEAEFRVFTGSDHAVALTNGTAALHLAVSALGLSGGDEVVVPSLTFVASANAIAYTGATPIFADIASLTEPWLSVESVERAVSERTKAVMFVSYGGHPGELVEIGNLTEQLGLHLIEDAAHSVGSRIGGRHLGTVGGLGAFSFFSNKNLPVGEGGMLVTDDERLAARARLLRSHGMSSMTWDRHRGHAHSYDVVELGFNYRIDEPRAALASARLKRVEAENRARREVVTQYRRALADVRGIAMTMPDPDGPVTLSHHLFTVLLDLGVDRDAFRAKLADAGIQTSVHYPPAHRFRIYSAARSALPITEEYAARTVTLPLFPHMAEEQISLVVEACRDAVGC